MSTVNSENRDRVPPQATEALWRVEIKTGKCNDTGTYIDSGEITTWEISVVRKDYELGQISWGWFDERKLLISHNGGPCHWPIVPIVWERMVALAHEVRDHLNSGGSPENWEKT